VALKTLKENITTNKNQKKIIHENPLITQIKLELRDFVFFGSRTTAGCLHHRFPSTSTFMFYRKHKEIPSQCLGPFNPCTTREYFTYSAK